MLAHMGKQGEAGDLLAWAGRLGGPPSTDSGRP